MRCFPSFLLIDISAVIEWFDCSVLLNLFSSNFRLARLLWLLRGRSILHSFVFRSLSSTAIFLSSSSTASPILRLGNVCYNITNTSGEYLAGPSPTINLGKLPEETHLPRIPITKSSPNRINIINLSRIRNSRNRNRIRITVPISASLARTIFAFNSSRYRISSLLICVHIQVSSLLLSTIYTVHINLRGQVSCSLAPCCSWHGMGTQIMCAN